MTVGELIKEFYDENDNVVEKVVSVYEYQNNDRK